MEYPQPIYKSIHDIKFELLMWSQRPKHIAEPLLAYEYTPHHIENENILSCHLKRVAFEKFGTVERGKPFDTYRLTVCINAEYDISSLAVSDFTNFRWWVLPNLLLPEVHNEVKSYLDRFDIPYSQNDFIQEFSQEQLETFHRGLMFMAKGSIKPFTSS